MMYGIIGAQEVEVRLLREKMEENGPVTHTQLGGLDFCGGVLGGKKAVVVRSGVGKVNGALCAQALILKFGVTAVCNTGIAGAIGEGLKPMDLVFATDLVYHDMDATGFGYELTEIPEMLKSVFLCDKFLLQAAKTAARDMRLPFFEGRVATGDKFVASHGDKTQIQMVCRPLAVEMEGAAIAHAAFLHKVPFLVIRCISDQADDVGKETYQFNETAASNQSAALVLRMLRELP